MTLETLLNLLVRFGVRSDLIDQDEKEFYLHYLNLAHLELYRHVAPYLPSLVTVFEGRTVNGEIELPQKPFMVLGVQNQNTRKTLKLSRPEQWIGQNFKSSDEGAAEFYWMKERLLTVVPREDTLLRIYFTPSSSDLTLDTPEDHIPYPREFHPILIDGALKYLQQDVDTSSIKDDTRIKRAAAEWEQGKGALMAFIINSGGSLRTQTEYF